MKDTNVGYGVGWFSSKKAELRIIYFLFIKFISSDFHSHNLKLSMNALL